MNEKSSTAHREEISELLKELVITRIEAQMPSNLKMSIGSYGSFTKNQLIQHVTDDDEIGRQVMKMHIRFIRAQANGQLVDALNSVADE